MKELCRFDIYRYIGLSFTLIGNVCQVNIIVKMLLSYRYDKLCTSIFQSDSLFDLFIFLSSLDKVIKLQAHRQTKVYDLRMRW